MSTVPRSRSFPYSLVDVFAERALEGNMLAIFTNAHGLTDDQMQALARETNLAETTFILPHPDHEREARQGVRVRIFTTEEELPFAGHPTLGTASWLFWNHPTLAGAQSIVLDLNGGPVTVRFDPAAQDAAAPGIYGTMRQHDPWFGLIHDRAAVARALGLDLEDLDPALPVQTVSTGLPFAIVPARSQAVVERLKVSQALAQPYLARTDAKFFYVFAPTAPGWTAAFHARMQFYNGEDPATGSASGCAIAYMVLHGLVPSQQPVILEQGVEIFRPSRIFVQARLTDGEVTDVFVSGRTIPVASGQFSLS